MQWNFSVKMKHLHQFFFCMALFVVIAYAASPQVLDTDLVHNATANVTTNTTYPDIGPNDLVFNYEDLMSGPEPEDHFTNISTPATAFTALNSDPTEGNHGLIIRMGMGKQHVAELKGQRMFNTIIDALKKMCPLERGQIGCYGNMPGAKNPNDDGSPSKDLVFYKKVLVRGVPYKDDDGNYATNAWLTLNMTGIFRDQQFSGLGAATYELIAGVYKAATEHAENCYQEKFNLLSRPYELCNAPDHVMVALPVHKGQIIQSWLSLKLEFNGPTKFGDLNCYTAMSPVIKFWEGNVLPDVAEIIGTSVSDWKEACTECFKEGDAFDVHKWRSFKSDGCSYLDYAPN